MTDQFDKLRAAYAITLGGQLMPGAGVYGVGAVASVMPEEGSARAWIEEYAEVLASLERGLPGIIQVGDPWKLMRRAAGEALAGIEGADREVFPFRFMFMVRVEEAGAKLPTVLASITSEGWDDCLTRSGERALDHAEVLHWCRFDTLDRVTGEWGQRCPFRYWEHGDNFYELRSESEVVLLADVPLLADWNSTEGAFAFFTSEEEATLYRHHHPRKGRVVMLGLGRSDGPNDSRDDLESLRCWPVTDLKARLAELADIMPFAAWCVNPDGHRENSGYGRLHYGGDHPAKLCEEGPRMAAVSGIWNVMSNNFFGLKESIAAWTGMDTIRWSGGQSLQLLPLGRSFVLDPRGSELDDHVTESDAEEQVSQLFQATDQGKSRTRLDEVSANDLSRLDQFFILCWDSVTGERADPPLRFPTFLAALKHLYEYERDRDHHYRREGAFSRGYIGFSGSGDADSEDLHSARFRLGLSRLGSQVPRLGYRPSDAADLTALCNRTHRTLHIDYTGFAKDLLWASPSEQEDELLDRFGIKRAKWTQWSDSADADVDPLGKKLVIERLGTSNWELLLPKVRHFLATALVDLNEQGHAPQLDYAPVSLEVAKALEVELAEVLGGFRDSVSGLATMSFSEDHQRSLASFLKGKRPPTLGNMGYLLRKPGEDASELLAALHRYLIGLKNADFLTSNKFLKRGLPRVINKFRNGGVHDSPISEDVCRDCVETLIGTPERLGYIPQVTQWKVKKPGERADE